MWVLTKSFLCNVQVHLASCQLLLTVELFEFRNPYLVEFIKSEHGFCCCDSLRNLNRMCTNDFNDVRNLSCKTMCSTWLNISLSVCQSPYQCSATTADQCNSPPVLELDYKFEFIIPSSSDTVSLNIMSNNVPLR